MSAVVELHQFGSCAGNILENLLAPINSFLRCSTPDEWISAASKPENLSIILLDHLVCELKAAQSAMYLIRRYAIDESSAEALLLWLKPFEDFTYRQQGDWRDLAGLSLKKSMLPKASSAYAQELIDKIKKAETFNKGYQVTELLAAATLDIAWHSVEKESDFKPTLEFEKEALQNNLPGLNFRLSEFPDCPAKDTLHP